MWKWWPKLFIVVQYRDVSEFWPKSLKMLLSVKSEGILHHKCIRVIKSFWKYSWTKLHLISILLGNHQHLISSIKVTTVWLQSTGILKFPETGRYDRNVLLLHSGCIECLKSFLDKKKKATNEVKIIKKSLWNVTWWLNQFVYP